MTTTIQAHRTSLVKHFAPLLPRKMKKYRLVYDHKEQRYNGAVELDPESSKFATPQASMVIRDLARSLSDVSKAIGRVCCYVKGSPNPFPRGMTTGFYIDQYHILTNSTLMEDEHGNLTAHEGLNFSFTLRISTKIWEHVQPTLVPAFFVCQTENLLLLRTSPPSSAISPVLPFKEFMTTTTFDPNNTDSSYVNATSICVVGYCDGVTIAGAIEDHSSLSDNIRATIPIPTAEDVTLLPKDHKSLFHGRIISHVMGAPAQYCVTASMHHGGCGSPVFCPADPTKFIGIVLSGAEMANYNIILTVLSNEFDTIFTAAINA